MAEKGGVVMDYHSNDFFPQRFFDLVLVLRTDNTVLFDRLKARCERKRPASPADRSTAYPLLSQNGRGYSEKKIQENVEAEIMQVRPPAWLRRRERGYR